MNSLETRKQLLLLESDLNRTELIGAVQDWKDACHHTKEQLTHLGALASTATKVAATFSTVRGIFSGPKTGEKKSWLSMIMKGMTTGTSLWYLLKSQRRKSDD